MRSTLAYLRSMDTGTLLFERTLTPRRLLLLLLLLSLSLLLLFLSSLCLALLPRVYLSASLPLITA